MIEEPESSMKLKTYKVDLMMVLLEDENAEGNVVINEFLQNEIMKKINYEYLFTDKHDKSVFFFGFSVDNIKLIRSINPFK